MTIYPYGVCHFHHVVHGPVPTDNGCPFCQRNYYKSSLIAHQLEAGTQIYLQQRALERIIKLDTREAHVCIHSDPAGCDYTVEEFPGSCARIAMEALGVEEVKNG